MGKKFKVKPFKDYLDDMARVACKARDDYTCQKCHKTVSGHDAHCHHIRTRNYNHLRWDLVNLITLCSGDHDWVGEGAMGGVWVKDTFPWRYDYVYSKPRHKGTWKEADFREIEDYLIGKLVDFEAEPSEKYLVRFNKRRKELGL